MSANSIYQIDAWTPNTSYTKDYIVTINNLYYYSAFNQTSSASFSNDLAAGNWNGYIWDKGISMPFFPWRHSYKAQNKNVPKVKVINFSDGYAVRIPDGINSLLLNYNLTFENRSLTEVTAILHFLSVRNGYQSFCWLPASPRGQVWRFVCPEWGDIQDFYQNYSITASFIQVPV